VAGDAAIDWILDHRGDDPALIPAECLRPESSPNVGKVREQPKTDQPKTFEDFALAASALRFITPMAVDYNDWLMIGMALHELGEAGLALWNEWSKLCKEKYEDGACAAKWATFSTAQELNGQGVTLGTLFNLAQKNGWAFPKTQWVSGATAPGAAWGPIRFGELPPVEEFPIDVLPTQAARLVRTGASAIGCPPDFLGLPILAVAGGTIGRSCSLLLKPGYFVSPTIYAACIGPPSDGKTPALKAVAIAVRSIDDELATEYAQALERWKQDTAELPKGTKPPPKPKPRRIDIDDATMEVLPIILADNPRGLIMTRDELTAFVLGMNQFKGGRGNDRSNAIKIWSGDRIVKDRVSHENSVPVRCPHPMLTIVGGLTPDMLGELVDPKGRADGFLDRFLTSYPDSLPVPDWSSCGIPDGIASAWNVLIARLWMRVLARDQTTGHEVPHAVRFTDDGLARWEALYNAHISEMNADDFDPALRGPWGKFREHAGRLTLILTLMHHAADPSADPLALPRADRSRVEEAWCLASYFKSHARRVYAAISRGPGIGGGRIVKAIVEWIRAGNRQSFSERDIKQARRWIQDRDLAAALVHLTQVNAIRRRAASPTKPQGGHPPSPTYEVNPAIFP
jgi:hypothetical protein